MVNFQYPDGAEQFEAAAFHQDGTFITAGHRESCELAAIEAGGLYCWWVNGRPVIKSDFEDRQ
ncbi:hypothetical protein [Paracidovorax oryzae]|uniref:hypothetical protein n=1 Tax=Paracidovorax oryzae TaxID=862720 RepID=UPI0034A2E6B7